VLAAGGKAFSVDAAALPSGRGDGSPMNTLVNSGADEIVRMGLGDAATPLLIANTAGNGFLCELGNLATKTKQGKDFMTVPVAGIGQFQRAGARQACHPGNLSVVTYKPL
jgi:topoisomerase-4 subunit A